MCAQNKPGRTEVYSDCHFRNARNQGQGSWANNQGCKSLGYDVNLPLAHTQETFLFKHIMVVALSIWYFSHVLMQLNYKVDGEVLSYHLQIKGEGKKM